MLQAGGNLRIEGLKDNCKHPKPFTRTKTFHLVSISRSEQTDASVKELVSFDVQNLEISF